MMLKSRWIAQQPQGPTTCSTRGSCSLHYVPSRAAVFVDTTAEGEMPAIDDGPPVYELSEEEKKCWSALRRVLGTTACRGWTPVAEVLPGLFLSGCELAGDGERLKTLGITHVLNCAPLEVPTGAVFYEPLDISYCELPAFVDSEATDFLHYWDTARDFIQSARQQQQDGTRQCRQLIHCRAGVNRSGVIAVAYVMLESQVSVLEAVRRVKSKRTCVLTNETFQQGLVKLAAALGYMDDTLPPVQHLDSLAEDDEEDDEEGGTGRSGQGEEEEDDDSEEGEEEEDDDDEDDDGLGDKQRRHEREAAGAEEEQSQRRGEGQSKVQSDAGLDTVQSRQCS